MLKNFIKIALRNIISQKLYSAVNILGLAIGLGVCLLILGVVNNDLRFEDTHKNKDHIYRVDGKYAIRDSQIPMAPIVSGLGPALREAIPEIEKVVRIRREWDVNFVFENNESMIASKVFMAEPELLEIFTLPLHAGNPGTALNAPYSVIISQDIKQKYFLNRNAIGEKISANDSIEFTITGVFERIPANTQIRSDFVLSYSTLDKTGKDTNSWTELFKDYTYVLLNKNADPKIVENKIPDVIAQKIEPEMAKRFQLQLQPLKDIYFESYLSYELPPHGNFTQILIFAGIAGLILIIGCLNFVNITSARTINRIKEVGIRKVLGAYPIQLVKQFLTETTIITLCAMTLGIIIFEIFRPLMESFIGRNLEIDLYRDPILLLSIFGMITFVGIFAGSYPALLFSRFRPTLMINKGSGSSTKKSTIRRIMVAAQFIMAIVLICATMAIYQQINFCVTSDLGFDKENMLCIDVEELSSDKVLLLKNEILRQTSAEYATMSDMHPGEDRNYLYSVKPENKMDEDPTYMHGVRIDNDYFTTYGIEIINGRGFLAESGDAGNNNILINEASIRTFEIDDPIDFQFMINGKQYSVIGVVKDFHQHSLKNEIMPMAFFNSSKGTRILGLKMPEQNSQSVTDKIGPIWEEIEPGIQLEYRYLSDALRESYNDEKKTATILTLFSSLAIFVACLGLFGLAAYNTEKRTKEIGIRKVLGAKVGEIIRLMVREYIIIILISGIISLPIANYIIGRWLEEFAYRMDVDWQLYLMAGVVTLIVALFTVGYQAIKAAITNPVDAIKYE